MKKLSNVQKGIRAALLVYAVLVILGTSWGLYLMWGAVS